MGARFGQLGRGTLLILGIVIIIALVAGAFIYGNQKRREVAQPEQQTADQPVQPPEGTQPTQPNQTQTPDQGQPTQNTAPSGGQTGGESAQPGTSGPANPPTSTAPTTGPEAVPNAGPEDYAPLVATVVALLAWRYRRSRRQMLDAQLAR